MGLHDAVVGTERCGEAKLVQEDGRHAHAARGGGPRVTDLVGAEEDASEALDEVRWTRACLAGPDQGARLSNVLEEALGARQELVALKLSVHGGADGAEVTRCELVPDGREGRDGRARWVQTEQLVHRRAQLVDDREAHGLPRIVDLEGSVKGRDLLPDELHPPRELRERRHVHRSASPLVGVGARSELHGNPILRRARGSTLAKGATLLVEQIGGGVDEGSEGPALRSAQGPRIERGHALFRIDHGARYHRCMSTGGPGSVIGRVLAVCLSTGHAVTVGARSYQTGIQKTPVLGARQITVNGLAGDVRVEPRKYGEPNHAVHAYPHEHYAHWEGLLDRAPMPMGQLGENLTTRGLLETDLCVGDHLRFGTAVLEATQPRIPCRKLNVRMGTRFAGAFLRSARVGVFFRVVEPGEVEAGDAITLLQRVPGAPTIDQMFRLSQLEYWDAEGLEGLLATPGLIEEWRGPLEDKLARARGADGWAGLRDLEVLSRTPESEGTVSFRLGCPRGKRLPHFRGGQSLVLHAWPDAFAAGLRRPYAISSAPGDPEGYRVTIARHMSLADGPASRIGLSRYLNDSVHSGDVIRAEAPRGEFVLPGSGAAPMIFISHGIGVAPITSMLHEWSRRPHRGPAIHLHVGGSLFALGRELETLAAAHPELVLHRARELSRSLATQLPPSPQSWCFVAGESAFVDETVGLLLEAGQCPSRLRAQRFGRQVSTS